MRILSPLIHGVLDYAVVVAFVLLPTLLGLSGTPRYLSWTLAAVHLALTALTRFPLGAIKLVPVRVHGIVELVVGPVLIAAPWLLGFASDAVARATYVAAGVAIFFTWLLTDYSLPEPASAPPRAAP